MSVTKLDNLNIIAKNNQIMSWNISLKGNINADGFNN